VVVEATVMNKAHQRDCTATAQSRVTIPTQFLPSAVGDSYTWLMHLHVSSAATAQSPTQMVFMPHAVSHADAATQPQHTLSHKAQHTRTACHTQDGLSVGEAAPHRQNTLAELTATLTIMHACLTSL